VQQDTVNQMDPGAADPIGTKAEVKALRLPLVKYASCSLPGKANRGCQHFDHPVFGACPIRALLVARGRPGPENIGVLTIKSAKDWKEDAMPCFTYMNYLYRMDRKIARNKILGIGGDKTIRRRSTVPIDPDNKRGGATKVKFENEPVLRFPRPNETMAERVELMRVDREIMDSGDNQQIAGLAGGVDEQEDMERGDEMTDDDFVGEPVRKADGHPDALDELDDDDLGPDEDA
jgi:hypothetical protein